MLKIYKCRRCSNIVILAEDGGGVLSCCGEEMQLLEANVTDASAEKHVPVVETGTCQECGRPVVKVKVGSAAHPMVEVHYIQFLILEIEREGTGNAYRMAKLIPGNAPEACFVLQKGEKAVAVYAYCNLHGLWKADVTV